MNLLLEAFVRAGDVLQVLQFVCGSPDNESVQPELLLLNSLFAVKSFSGATSGGKGGITAISKLLTPSRSCSKSMLVLFQELLLHEPRFEAQTENKIAQSVLVDTYMCDRP